MKIRVFEGGKGDCLLLQSSDGKHILVDGGLVSSSKDHYSANVASFLTHSLQRHDKPLDLVCVSHIDQDHIGGILRLLNDHFEWRVFDFRSGQGLNVARPANLRPPAISQIWHNAFHEQLDKNEGDIEEAIAAAVPESLALQLHPSRHGHDFMQNLATSMKEAAQVSRRIGSAQLGIPLNETFGGRLAMFREDAAAVRIGNFKIRVVGPTGTQLEKLREEWDEWLRSDKGIRQVGQVSDAAEEDETLLENGQLNEFLAQRLGRAVGRRSSVSEENVASIVMFVEDGTDNILLTGDARDDHVVDDLKAAGIADDSGHAHVKVLKLQHHGSEHNFSQDFAKKVTADHYLLCGNGEHENPDFRVVDGLMDSRLTEGEARSPNKEAGRNFKLWFSADETAEHAKVDHMVELKRRVALRAQQSNGRMSFHFSDGPHFSFNPR